MGTRQEWVSDFLATGGYPLTDDNVRACLAWGRSEWGSTAPPGAAFNLFDTTQPAPGATDYNSAGVKNYPDWWTAVHANVATLAQDFPGYQSIRDHLHAGQDASATCAAVSASPWGSHPTDEMLVEVVNDPANNADALVGDRPDGPVPPPPVHTNTGDDDSMIFLTPAKDGHSQAFAVSGGIAVAEFLGAPHDTGYGVTIPTDAADAIAHGALVVTGDQTALDALIARTGKANAPATPAA